MLECNRKVLESVEPLGAGQRRRRQLAHRPGRRRGGRRHRALRRPRAGDHRRDTVLRDTYVGPFTSIYFGCLLEDTEIEHSIVLEQSTIRGVGRIEDSLIGKEVEVSPSTACRRPTGSCSATTAGSPSPERRQRPAATRASS
jgi:glucose-1-phosphate thymidylyltransferase